MLWAASGFVVTWGLHWPRRGLMAGPMLPLKTSDEHPEGPCKLPLGLASAMSSAHRAAEWSRARKRVEHCSEEGQDKGISCVCMGHPEMHQKPMDQKEVRG
jgi:hypothetical protein